MKYQKRELEGREHFVLPVVLLKEGVLNGTQGRLFYPRDEIRKSVLAWNGRPIVSLHPDIHFNEGSAGAPEVFDSQKVGVLFSVRLSDDRLIGEAWIDAERAAIVDNGKLLDAINQGRPIEVSTGLWTEAEPIQGVFNGQEYHYVATQHRPDHLAILLDQEGACSLADGCGMLRQNSVRELEPLHMVNW